MDDIEDLGFNLIGGSPVRAPLSLPLANSSCGVIELSRREDAATALEDCWEALVLRYSHNVRTNALIGKKYRLDLSDPKWRVLVLWTKDPGTVKKYLKKEHPETGNTLFDSWPAIYVVLTLNGYHPELEPGVRQTSLEEILKDTEDLAELLCIKQGAHPHEVIYPKVGDPLVRYKWKDETRENWSDSGPIFKKLDELGFTKVHYGPLDTRGIWKRAEDMAKEQGIELLPFDWEDPQDIASAVKKLQEKAGSMKLVTCSDRDRFHKNLGGPKIREGICVSLRALNRLLTLAGSEPLKSKKSTKPGGGKRTCNCQDTADIGQNVLRSGYSERTKCRECAYCFVRCKSNGSQKRKRHED
jgi:hypothetical protein